MKYSIEISKIIEGALNLDTDKVKNYTKQLIDKLNDDNDTRTATRLDRIIEKKEASTLVPKNIDKSLKKKIPVDSESRFSMVDIFYPDEIKSNPILSKENTEKVDIFIKNYQFSDKLHEQGLSISNSLMLYGPPGCGKTETAYFISKNLKLPLVVARLDSLISSYLGTTSKNIRSLFEYIESNPCILFLDEFDAIGKARDDANELGELKRVVNSLLQNLDSVSEDTLVIAATNHDSLLDPAIWRRFDYKIHVDYPDENSITKMLESFLLSIEISDKDKVRLAKVFSGLSGSDIKEVISKARRKAVINDESFTLKDIYDEIFDIKRIYSYHDSDKEKQIKISTYLRNIDERLFSYSFIGGVLDISKSQVSNLLRIGEDINE